MRFFFTPSQISFRSGIFLAASALPLSGSLARSDGGVAALPRPGIVPEEAPTLEEVVVTGQSDAEGDQPTLRRNQERQPKREPCFWKHLKPSPWSRASSLKTKESRIWKAP